MRLVNGTLCRSGRTDAGVGVSDGTSELMADPDYGKITDERVAKMRARIGLDLDPDNFLPLDPEVAKSWKPRSTGFIHELSGDTARHFVNGYGDDNPLY